ncbi:MAG TPA: FGGY family carbohydrate kinase, partial [Candidatus Competibacteraceae bacterium]|nr:FGGY family carbohydrate kinase [Candidatus Competibacteraceae bacterium]
MSSQRSSVLTIDLGTGSVRAAVIGRDGRIIACASRPHDQEIPFPGWSEQSPQRWWQEVVAILAELLQVPGVDTRTLAGLCVCGQMHGPVPIAADGEPLLERVQLWNDKRCAGLVAAFARRQDAPAIQTLTGNPAAPSWTAFKVAWLRAHQADVYERAATFLAPKDFINFRLTGVRATDGSEASGSFLLNWQTLDYDDGIAAALGLDRAKFPPIHPSHQVIGTVTRHAATTTGLPEGLPVVAGGGDFPVAMLGSGVIAPGMGADITGTSTVIAAYATAPVLAAGLSNLCAVNGGWLPFTTVDAGGDSLCWARRVFGEPHMEYATVCAMARAVPAGSEELLFLPYLHGERLGGRSHARAQFFGITERHGKGHFYRAVMEGLAFAARRNLARMRAAGIAFEHLVASGGGARDPLWLAIKASVYDLPLAVPENTESGLLGAAALAGLGTGLYPDAGTAVAQLIRLRTTVFPEPALVDYYARL